MDQDVRPGNRPDAGPRIEQAASPGGSAPGGLNPSIRRVRIDYVEPEFQARNPHSPAQFSSFFDFPLALSKDEALERALEEWDFCSRHSHVGWRRVIVSVSQDPED